ncbi:hypothetical protein CRUP_024603, partial [Coryphaenoides rupestris]
GIPLFGEPTRGDQDPRLPNQPTRGEWSCHSGSMASEDIIDELITEDNDWGQGGRPGAHLFGPVPGPPPLPLPPPPPPTADLRLCDDSFSSSEPVLVARGTAHTPRPNPPSGVKEPCRDPPPPPPPPPPCGSGSDTELLESLLEKPKLVVVEEPKERGMRFRYECEGRSAGSILGASSTGTTKIQPAIEIQGPIDNMKNVTVTVSLVTRDIPYRPHPHCLVGKDCPEGSGICVVSFNPHTSRQHSQNIDPFRTGQSKSIEDMDMNVVRLCFQCDLEWDDGRKDCLSPVVSNPIYDKKATTTSQLKITCLNIIKGSCTGSTEIYMLCDKVQKDDIEIIFKHGSWEAKGEFAQTDVHRQIAIVFKTPPYQERDIGERVEVDVVLRRISDRMDNPYEVNRKRKIKTDISLADRACGAAHSAAMEVSSSQTFPAFPGADSTAPELPPPPAHPDAAALGDPVTYSDPQDVNLLGQSYDMNDDLLLTQLLEMPSLQAMLLDPALNSGTPLEPGSNAGTYVQMDVFNDTFGTYGHDFFQYSDMQFNNMVSESQPDPLAQEPCASHKVQVKTEED